MKHRIGAWYRIARAHCLIARCLPRRSTQLALLVLVALGVAATACTGVASPEGWASPVASDDLIFAAHEDDLFALESGSLAEQWAFPSDEIDVDVDALYGTPAMLGDTLFVPTYEGTLYAIDASSFGQLLWRFETDGPLIGGVVVAEGAIYFGSDDGNVYALDPETGRSIWRAPFETGDGVWSTPALEGDVVYVTSLDGDLYALDAATGVELWSFGTGAGIASPPVVNTEAGLVYVGGFDGRLRAIDTETHEERWSLKADNWFWTRPLLADDVLFAGNLDGNVYAVDALTGDLVWPRFPTEGPVRAAPVIAGGTLVVVDRDGNVYGIDPSDGIARVAFPLALESDVLADPLVLALADVNEGDEVVVLVTTDGDVVQIDAATLTRVGAASRLGS